MSLEYRTVVIRVVPQQACLALPTSAPSHFHTEPKSGAGKVSVIYSLLIGEATGRAAVHGRESYVALSCGLVVNAPKRPAPITPL